MWTLKYLFNLSTSITGVFPDDLKIAKVTMIYKADNGNHVRNYRSISELPCFSKMLEQIMYNRLQKNLKNQNILYNKQFGFQTSYYTDHSIAQLVDQNLQGFREKEIYFRCVYWLSKASDTADHSILLRNLELYCVTDRNYSWIKNDLSNRLQYTQVDENCRTEYCLIRCGTLQGSMLGPLLFLLYVNGLKNACSVLNPIMFADDTNISIPSQTYKRYIPNKLPLNTKTNSFFDKPSKERWHPFYATKVDYQ